MRWFTLLLTICALIAALGLLAVPSWNQVVPGYLDQEGGGEAQVGEHRYASPSEGGERNVSAAPYDRDRITGWRTVTFRPIAHEPRPSPLFGLYLWRELGLRAALSGPEGVIAEDLDPDEAISVEVPAGVRAMTFSLPGYRSAELDLPSDNGALDLGTVELTPDARIDIVVEGLPHLEHRWLRASVEVVVDQQTSIVLKQEILRSRGGRATISWPMLSGLPHRLTLSSYPNRTSTVGIGALSAEFMLTPGEERNLVLDLDDVSSIELELTGLPAGAAAHQLLSIGEAVVRTDATGRCRIYAVPRGSFRVILASCLPSQPWSQGEGVPLVDADSGSEMFTDPTGILRVRPGRDVLALSFTTAGRRETSPHAVWDLKLPLRPTPGIQLVERSWLRRESVVKSHALSSSPILRSCRFSSFS